MVHIVQQIAILGLNDSNFAVPSIEWLAKTKAKWLMANENWIVIMEKWNVKWRVFYVKRKGSVNMQKVLFYPTIIWRGDIIIESKIEVITWAWPFSIGYWLITYRFCFIPLLPWQQSRVFFYDRIWANYCFQVEKVLLLKSFDKTNYWF